MNHINLANTCDAILIVPCTANYISKIASGVADDLATNVILASNKMKVIAPAMNSNMWENAAVKKNLKTLINMGTKIFNPKSGKLACGSKGNGKLMDVEMIVDELNFLFSEKQLEGKKAIVTAGPSVEKIDPVRFISNFSSGLQGYLIAETLAHFGAQTLLISGPTTLQKPQNVNLISVQSGNDYLIKSIENLPVDIFVSVAAISDWMSNKIVANKIKKNKSQKISFNFVQNVDVLKEICNHKHRPKLVIGFSAETKNLITNSKKKLLEKGCDWILANNISDNSGFNSDMNKVCFITEEKTIQWKMMNKKNVSKKLVKKIVSFFKKDKLVSYE
jgi:phosphopantothenoylcysteine decarboxylase/phosphopantothenate--cysteine ligase